MGFFGVVNPSTASVNGICQEPRAERQRTFRTEGLDITLNKTAAGMTYSYLGLLAGDKAELLNDLHEGQLHHQLSESHADTVSGPGSKGQVGIRIIGVFVFLAEPK